MHTAGCKDVLAPVPWCKIQDNTGINVLNVTQRNVQNFSFTMTHIQENKPNLNGVMVQTAYDYESSHCTSWIMSSFFL